MKSSWLPYDEMLDQYARTEITGLMRIFLYIIPSIAVVLSTVNFIIGNTNVAITTLLVPIFCIPSLYFLHKGYINSSMIIITSIMIITTSIVCTQGARVHEVGIIIFPVTVFFASMVMNLKGVILTISAVAICLAIIVFGEQFGYFENSTHEPGWVDLLVVLAVLIVHTFITFSFSRITRNNLSKVQVELQNQKHFKEEISENLSEKTELLRLVHHRVKNNLLLVNSLIELETYEKPEIKQELKEVIESIYTIARAHDPLYHTEDYKQVSIKPYLEKLIATFVQSNAVKGLDTKFEDYLIFHEKALLLGIILQKILSSISRLDEMTLTVSLELNNNHLELCVMSKADHQLELNNTSLIQLLVEQIDGKMMMSSNEVLISLSKKGDS